MILNKFKGFLNSTKKRTQNLFNESFLSWVGSSGTKYDANGKTYLEKGYNINSVVYSIIQQQARKTAHVPFFIKKVEKESEAKTFIREVKQANVSQPQMKLLLKNLEKKAFLQGEGHLNMPILKPNVSQSWNEFIALYKTMLKLNGNVYIYMLAPDEGANNGVPMGFYILPSHMVNIVLKVNANLLSDESPVDHYTMIENSNYIEFPEDSIVHIKYPNPNFDLLGSHLYGASPLKPALDNIESSNEAMNQNIKTLKNGGSYGFVHGKSQPITPDQAKELKSRLKEMDDNPERLSRIAGISAEIGFTRLSLTTDELRPFEYLDYDQKQICNVLGWSDKLLNNSEGAKYDNVKEYRKQVLTDDILPDLDLLEAAFNEIILPRFKGYENTLLYFDATTLPEMQADMNTLTVWLSRALLDGVISRNEYREAMNYPKQDSEDFERFTTKMGIVPLEETFIEEQPDLLIDEEKAIVYKAGFDKNQPRDKNGQWGSWNSVDYDEQLSAHNEFGGSSFDLDGDNLIGKKNSFSVGIFEDKSLELPIGQVLTKDILKNYYNKYKDILLSSEDLIIGTWIYEGRHWIDITKIVTGRMEAKNEKRLGVLHNQIKIFDLENVVEIDTGGTGK